jgi:hypothetical protein
MEYFIYTVITRCGYEGPGTILLHDLQVDHSKDMSVYVSTCTSYDFNPSTPFL